MHTPTNKNKVYLNSFVSPRNVNQNNISFTKKISEPQSQLITSNLSFANKEETKKVEALNYQKLQTKNSQKNTPQISKNLSSPNIRNTWGFNPKEDVTQQSQNKVSQKASNRLKTTQTVQSEVFAEENIGKFEEFFDLKASQPCDPSVRQSTVQLKQKYLLKQNPRPQPFKFSQSSFCLKPTLQSSISSIKGKNLQNKNSLNDSRLKLRDYLFMVSTSANLAAQKRHSLNNSHNVSPQDKSKNKSFSRLNQTKTQIITNPQKYRITNQQMCQVLKKQIKVDLNNLKNKLNCIGKWVNGLESVDNDQIKHLYELRREVQQYSSQIEDYCVNKMGMACPSVQESIVNIIHENEEQDFFVGI